MMDIEEILKRVREARELAATTVNWIEEPTSDAPALVVAYHTLEHLELLELDIMSDVLTRRDLGE